MIFSITFQYRKIASLCKNIYILPYCTAVCAVVLLSLVPIPFGNEYLYLLRLYSTYHADFLINDWTFGAGAPEHFLFNHIFGLFTLFLPMETVGWLGRIFAWAAIIAIIFRLARHFSVDGWGTVAVILAWIGIGQSLVGGEWLFWGFEAKCVSYLALFGAFVLLLESKEMLGALLLGLSFSFHPAVGFWGVLATYAALPALNMTARRFVTFAIFTGIGMSPGVITLAPHLIGGVQATQDDWAFLALVSLPNHLDPNSWPRRDILTLFLLWLVNWLYFIKNKSDRTLHFFFFFQTAAGAFFVMGIMWRVMGRYDLLQYFPFRIFPVLTPLFFFLFLAKAIRERRARDLGSVICYIWVLALCCLPNPIAGLVDRLSEIANARAMELTKDDFSRALQWISVNIPQSAIGIAPPLRADIWYLSRRGYVVNYRTPLYHKLPEWRERVEKLVGPVRPEDTMQDLQRRFEALSQESIVEVSKSYGADFLVSRSSYTFHRFAQVGEYSIYNIKDGDKLP